MVVEQQQRQTNGARWAGMVASLRARLPARDLVLLLPLLLVGVALLVTPTDADYWWHVRTGQLIWQTHSLPRTDPFSFTSAGKPWVTHEWLTEVLFFLVSRSFGYLGNVILYGLLTALTVALVYVTCRRYRLGPPGAALLALWAFLIISPLVNVRPQTVTMLLVAVTAYLLTRYRQGEPRTFWLLPPLFALWVNLHGGYVIGLVLLGLAVVGELLARLLGERAAPTRPLLVALILSIAATLLNPHGLEALRYPFSYAGTSNASQRLISEWQSPNFHQVEFYPFAASLLAVMLLGVRHRATGVTGLLWTALLAFMSLQSSRHMPLYAIVVLPLLAAPLADCNTQFAGFRRAVRPTSVWPASWRLALLSAILALLLLGATALAITPALRAHLQTGREPNPAGYPAGAVAYLRAHPTSVHLFNEYGWGGYLIYELYPALPVFIDGRADVHGDTLMARYGSVTTLAPGWQQTLADYQIGLVLMPTDSPLSTALAADPAWQQVYGDDTARLFQRRSPAGQSTP